MQKNKVIFLFAVIVVIALLFSFSSWTNARIVQDSELPASINIFSNLSPLLIGAMIVVALALLVMIIFN